MARPVTPRPASEHHATLSRMARQVDADEKLPAKRRAKIRRLLSDLLDEFKAEMFR